MNKYYKISRKEILKYGEKNEEETKVKMRGLIIFSQ